MIAKIVVLILLFAIPLTILVFALAPHEGRKVWFAHWTYAVGTIIGGVILVAIFDAALPLIYPAYEAYERWMGNILIKIAGPHVAHPFMRLMPVVIQIGVWYLGMAAGIWIVWRNRERDGK